MQDCGFAQLSFAFRGFFGEDVAFMRLFAFKAAASGFFETLAGTAVVFQFWHLFSPISNDESLRLKPGEAKCLAPKGFGNNSRHLTTHTRVALPYKTTAKLLFLFRSHDHDHLPSFQFGELLDGGNFVQIGFYAF